MQIWRTSLPSDPAQPLKPPLWIAPACLAVARNEITDKTVHQHDDPGKYKIIAAGLKPGLFLRLYPKMGLKTLSCPGFAQGIGATIWEKCKNLHMPKARTKPKKTEEYFYENKRKKQVF